MNIGDKIKQLRTQKMMTQADLAGEFITRNMLSRIENGFATPSVQTLVYLSGRLGVPAGYFLAEESEESMYRKQAAMPDILSAMRSQDWEIGYDMCCRLETEDSEIEYLKGIFAFNIGREAFVEGKIAKALHVLNEAWAIACRDTVYPVTWLKNMIAAYLIGISDISGSFDVPVLLPDNPPPTDGSDSFCSFYSVYRKIVAESRFPERLPEGEDAYSRLIRAAYFFKRGDKPKAYTELRAITLSDEEAPIPVVFYVFRDLEICCREMSDFKGAYEYAGLKNGMLERFLSQQAADSSDDGAYDGE